MFERERNILKSALGARYEILKQYDIIIAGGAITSVFTNRPINDFDMYFRDAETVKRFYITEVINCHNFVPQYLTHRAVTMMSPNADGVYQMVCCGLYETPEDAFKNFDFTLNMGAYDFKTEEFVLHPEFLLHNAQRMISINKDTKYPIASLVRVHKYLARGYQMIPTEWFKMAIMLHQYNIDSWDMFEDGLSGLYGEEVHIANQDDNTPFSWEEAMKRICKLQETELPNNRVNSADFVGASCYEQLRMIMSNFDYQVNCIRLASSRNMHFALNRYDILQDEDGRIFLQDINGNYDGLNITDAPEETYPIHVFKVVRKTERGEYVSLPHGSIRFTPGEILNTERYSDYLAVFDVCNLNTGAVSETGRSRNVILHMLINSPDWFAYQRSSRPPAILIKKALIVGEISLNEFRVIFKHEALDESESEENDNFDLILNTPLTVHHTTHFTPENLTAWEA